MGEVGQVTVHIKYSDVEQTFTGSVEDVWVSINRFFGEFVPSFEIARKLMLNIDLQKLAKDCEAIIAFSKEGPNLLVSRSRLTDNESLGLWLLANYVGYSLGMVKSDGLSKDDLQVKLGKSGKIASTRLGELVKSDVAMKTTDEKYRITTFGVIQMQRDALPRIKAKMTS